MNLTLSLNQPLISTVLSRNSNSWLRGLLLVMFGNALLIAASKIIIPLQPVPITLQLLAILFTGMAYGWRIGTLTIVAYLLEGLMGLPVFADPIITGLAAFTGPTGGYLIGFIPTVFVSGYLIERGWGRHTITTFLAGFIGVAITYSIGTLYLAQIVGMKQAIQLGVTPFIFGDILKLIFLTVIIPTLWKSKA